MSFQRELKRYNVCTAGISNAKIIYPTIIKSTSHKGLPDFNDSRFGFSLLISIEMPI
jgi:hypothetical protein